MSSTLFGGCRKRPSQFILQLSRRLSEAATESGTCLKMPLDEKGRIKTSIVRDT